MKKLKEEEASNISRQAISHNMTRKEIGKLRAFLINDISLAVNDFELATGMIVESLDISRAQNTLQAKIIAKILLGD